MRIGDVITYTEGKELYYIIKYGVDQNDDIQKFGYCYANSRHLSKMKCVRFSTEHEAYDTSKAKFIYHIGDINEDESKKLMLDIVNLSREIKINQFL